MRRCEHSSSQSGFNIIELMAVITIAGILLAIGLPQFQLYIKSSRLTAQSNSLIGALHLARSEAVTRGHNVRILSYNGNTTTWTNGWKVYLDVNNDGAFSSDDIVLRHYGSIEGATLISDTSTEDEITYKANGFATNASTLTLEAHNCTNNHKYEIKVRLSGLASSKRVAC